MLAAQRRTQLLLILKETGKIVAKDVAAELGISEDSIRRDLRELASEGLCQRVYGGALPTSPAIVDYATRQSVQPKGKHAVAKIAATLVRPGRTIILDGGTTALALAQALPKNLECTVITNSPTIAVALLDHPKIEIAMIGGRIFKHSAVTCGAAAVEATENISADLCFIGVTGVHPEAGLTTGDIEDAAMKRALARRSADTYILASSEKIGTASPYRVLLWKQISGVITDTESENPIIKNLSAHGINILNTTRVNSE
ncbi:MAG: DeoR/GlpR family DNA-binding transcription regulator [Micrococcaceae bacterium]